MFIDLKKKIARTGGGKRVQYVIPLGAVHVEVSWAGRVGWLT